MVHLKSALSAYRAQYNTNGLAMQHKCLGPGHIQRIEAVVTQAENSQQIMEEIQGIASCMLLDVYDGDAATDILDLLAQA